MVFRLRYELRLPRLVRGFTSTVIAFVLDDTSFEISKHYYDFIKADCCGHCDLIIRFIVHLVTNRCVTYFTAHNQAGVPSDVSLSLY